jgi:hypothetical protein
MKRKLALKRLSASDLTFFEHQFRNTAGTKQKAFNLDRSVFIDRLFPLLPETIGDGRSVVSLSLFGPGLAGLHLVQRKVLKQQKNWRLDGELIYNPPEQDGRYHSLKKGDFAIFDFAGDAEPKAASVYLVAEDEPADTPLHAALTKGYARSFSQHVSMVELDADSLGDLIDKVALPPGHPVVDLLDAEALEDAVQGGYAGTDQLRKRRRGRSVSKDEFARSKKAAEQTGRLGEEILNAYFDGLKLKGALETSDWISEENPIAPYDFIIKPTKEQPRKLDAKSTSGGFANPIHISMGELIEMATCQEPYDIYRLYKVTESSAQLRVTRDVRAFAKSIVEKLAQLPKGITADSLSIDPALLKFSGDIDIDISAQPELLG